MDTTNCRGLWAVVRSAGLALAAQTACADIDLPDATIDRGGVTFDFARISRARFATAFETAVPNLAYGVPGRALTESWRTAIDLAHTNGGFYTVSCRYRMRHVKPSRDTFFFSPGKYFCGYVLLETGGAWADLVQDIEVPKGTGKIEVGFNLRKGCSDFAFKDLAVVARNPPPPLELRTTATHLLDGTFAVPEGQTLSLDVCWKKNDAADYPSAAFVAEVELPAGIAFMDAGWADPKTVKTETRADGSSVTTFRVHREVVPPKRTFVGWSTLATVVKATRGVGPCGTGRVRVRFADGVRRVAAETEPIAFAVAPRLACALPRTYANGFMPYGIFSRLSEAANAALAETFVAAGCTWLAERATEKAYATWRQKGVRVITPSIYPIVDGYHICSPKDPVPASDRFVAADPATGAPLSGFADSVCPVTVYTRSDYFRTKTVPFMRDYLKGTDGAWSNWEPGQYAGKGCMCDRCCRAFADYLKKPYAEICAGWPTNVVRGGAYAKEIRHFRSLEHAKVVWTVDAVTRDVTKGSDAVGLIPAIAWIEMARWWQDHDYPPEQRQVDYAGKMAWMCPWGPYANWEAEHPYVSAKRKPLVSFFAAKDVRETVDRDYPDKASRPKLMALPQGRQCGKWIVQPEWLGMAYDSSFFNGFEATVGYYFPYGYDARHLAATAAATGRAARYEDFVQKGTRADATATLAPRAGFFANNVGWLSGYLEHVAPGTASPLQSVVWKRAGRTIVAVFNFWEEGEAFFNLKVSGLNGSVAVVDETGVWRAKDRARGLYAAADLATAGVDLVVPAARCRVFEFREDGAAADAQSVLTDAALERLFESRREDLRRAAERDAAYEKGCGPVAPDYFPVI